AAGLERLRAPGVRVGVGLLQVAGQVGAAEVVGKGDALPAQRGQLAAALGDQAVLVGLGLGLVRSGHVAPQTASTRLAPTSRPDFRLASMNSSRSPSSTFWVSERSMPVRRSLMRLWSST